MRANKILQNERLFAAENQRLLDSVEHLLPGEEIPRDLEVAFYCECPNKLCDEKIKVTLDMYEKIHARPDTFMVMPEHYLPEFEIPIKRNRNFWAIVKRREKLGKEFVL